MNGVITIYKNNGAPLLRRRRQRAPLRGEDLADDRVEAVAVLHGGDGRPGDNEAEQMIPIVKIEMRGN